VARAINTEVKEGRGSPHGGVFLDIASRRGADYIKRRLPSMYHQFKELAGVDITTDPMEVGPTCHYIMGGVRVDADTAATTVPGLFAAGEVAAGMHGANRLGGNSLSDLLVFGRRAGLYAAEHAKGCGGMPRVDESEVEAVAQTLLAPFECTGGENPYAIQAELQDCMQKLVGIIRTESELQQALEEIECFRQRLHNMKAEGNRQYNPGWHLALDLHPMLTVSEAVTRSALERKESRGGHTRDDYPGTDPELAKVNVVTRGKQGMMAVSREPLPLMAEELKELFEDAK
jgi:succinate dehydrogenase / fumarate reductase flavoprotein subunit